MQSIRQIFGGFGAGEAPHETSKLLITPTFYAVKSADTNSDTNKLFSRIRAQWAKRQEPLAVH
jgi:hypothetical protein